MAPLKYEEQLKEKLERRQLQPSIQAWDKLSNRLNANKKAKNRKPYWWLSVAASIVGIVFFVSQFIASKPSIDDTPKVVETPETIQKESVEMTSKGIENIVGDKSLVEVERIARKRGVVKLAESEIQNKDDIQASEAIAISIPKTFVIEANQTSVKPVKILKEDLAFEDKKVQDIVAQVQHLKEANNQVTEAEIDALLAEAQKEIRAQRFYNESTKKVDAMVLLEDVELQLIDQSFKDKVFEALKDSFITVKSALAQRND